MADAARAGETQSVQAGLAMPRHLRRERSRGRQRVTNIELFFDLVYVFAITQLSHYLLHHRTLAGALQGALLLAMVWLLWAYTTWVTNWLDPDRIPVRLLLVALMLVSLVMSAALPSAFTDSGVLVGCAYAAMQIGRSAFAVWALRGEPLRANFERILAWCIVSGGLAIGGGVAPAVLPRALLWLAAISVDLSGGTCGFYTPGLGRSTTREWDIEGGHSLIRTSTYWAAALSRRHRSSETGSSAACGRIRCCARSRPGWSRSRWSRILTWPERGVLRLRRGRPYWQSPAVASGV